MTKRGMIALAILIIILVLLGLIVFFQDNKPTRNTNTISNTDKPNVVKENQENDFALNITEDTGINLERLKSYSLPIILCFGSPEDEVCKEMIENMRILNHEMKNRAFIKYIDTDKYSSLWKDERLVINNKTMQILIDSEGNPFDTVESIAHGYSLIKDGNGEHIYTIHEGDLTLTEMRELLTQMEIK